MGVFEHFPYVNFHELNFAWMIAKIKELEDVIGSQIVDIVARAGVAQNAQDIADLTQTVNNNATTAHNEASAAQTTADNALAIANTNTQKLSNIGTVTSATGVYTTASWATGTNTCTWTAPDAGVYIVSALFYLQDPTTENRNSYKQLQITGSANRLTPSVLYFDATETVDSPMEARQVMHIVRATAAGQTVTPYVHTGAAGIAYDCVITAIRIA